MLPKAELQREYGQSHDDEDYYQGMFESHNVWRYFTHLVDRVDYRHIVNRRRGTNGFRYGIVGSME